MKKNKKIASLLEALKHLFKELSDVFYVQDEIVSVVTVSNTSNNAIFNVPVFNLDFEQFKKIREDGNLDFLNVIIKSAKPGESYVKAMHLRRREAKKITKIFISVNSGSSTQVLQPFTIINHNSNEKKTIVPCYNPFQMLTSVIEIPVEFTYTEAIEINFSAVLSRSEFNVFLMSKPSPTVIPDGKIFWILVKMLCVSTKSIFYKLFNKTN